MAAGGFKEFVAGETLDQDEINDFLMQGVLVFAGTAARGSAITAPVEGQFAFLKDSDALTFYDGTQWAELSTTPGAAVVSATTGSPTLGTVSSGGTTYNVYSFTGSGSITIDEAGFAELLVIGAGGGGGFQQGGGGGAGGYLPISAGYLPTGTLTVTVGAGGAGGASASTNGVAGQNGNSSRIGDFYSPGGGGAGGVDINTVGQVLSGAGGNGASGGGSSGYSAGGTQTAALGFSPLGNNGGLASVGGPGGGGGGASAVGANTATASTGGAGGAGTANSITGSSVSYAGGGGGRGTSTGGAGGTGGGGNGASGTTGSTAGAANTGGGGGGSDTNAAQNGGSGIVIVRVVV